MLAFDPTAPPLRGRAIMSQWWRDLAFVHWAVDPAVVVPLLPRGVRPDVLDGVTYVGLIPFRMRDAGIGSGPAIPYLGAFDEANVRLYSVDEQGQHAVVFRSLEATRLLVTLGARAVFGTAYMWSRMSVTETAGTLTYESTRRLPGPRGAGLRLQLRPGDPLPGPDDLSDFLTARFGLHTSILGRTYFVPNHHDRWPLQRAEVVSLSDSLVEAAGLPGVSARTPDSVLYSAGVRTTFGAPRRVC